MPQSPIDPKVIGQAPITVELGDDDTSNALEAAFDEIGYLSDELSQTRAELVRLQEQRTVEQVKAGIIPEFTKNVFWFVVSYCFIVGLIVVADGIGSWDFDLKESTIGIIAGSTAVSVIGLIGMVISGLFGGTKH